MKSIGQKIAELRKFKGFSQEGLAEQTNVNLRTIQRIEKDENKPSGTTLKMLCEVLEATPENILDHGKKDDKTVLNLMHLSVLTYLVLPIGNIFDLVNFLGSKKR